MAPSGDRLVERYNRFVTMFVCLLEAIVLRYGDDLLGLAEITGKKYSEVARSPAQSKSNKFSVMGAGLGELFGAVSMLPGAGSIGKALGKNLGSQLDKYQSSKHKKQWEDAIHANFARPAAETGELRGVLVETAAAIFCAYEMQFVTFESEGHDHVVMYALAVEAVDRILDNCTENHIRDVRADELTRAFVQGAMKDGSPVKMTLGGSSCSVTGLYDQVGLLKRGSTDIYYKKKKTAGRKTDKYGYRLLFQGEDPYESGYEMFNPSMPTINYGYSYVLDDEKFADKMMSGVLTTISASDNRFEMGELLDILTAIMAVLTANNGRVQARSVRTTGSRHMLMGPETTPVARRSYGTWWVCPSSCGGNGCDDCRRRRARWSWW